MFQIGRLLVISTVYYQLAGHKQAAPEQNERYNNI